MSVALKGTKTETVVVSVSVLEFLRTLKGFLKKEESQWIAKSDKEPGKLAVWSDHGGSHYYEGEDRTLTDAEADYFNACKVIEKQLMDMDMAGKNYIFSKEDEIAKNATKSKKS